MYDSIDIARAAIKIALTPTRTEEEELLLKLREKNIYGAAVDVGGDIVNSVHIMIERTILASRKSGVTRECHVEDGAVAGAAREAIMQAVEKAVGLNGGGKIAVCRHKEHLSVCVFLSVGLLHLNEAVIGLAHRSAQQLETGNN